MPPKRKEIARGILEQIKDADESSLKWDEHTGRVYIGGRPTSTAGSGSTILEYLQCKLSTTAAAKSKKPSGYKKFNEALKALKRKPSSTSSFSGKGGRWLTKGSGLQPTTNWLRY
jgi:hypothetical protein